MEETDESDAGFFILAKFIFGINAFCYGNANNDKRPVQTYNEEGEINHKLAAEAQHKEREQVRNK